MGEEEADEDERVGHGVRFGCHYGHVRCVSSTFVFHWRRSVGKHIRRRRRFTVGFEKTVNVMSHHVSTKLRICLRKRVSRRSLSRAVLPSVQHRNSLVWAALHVSCSTPPSLSLGW